MLSLAWSVLMWLSRRLRAPQLGGPREDPAYEPYPAPEVASAPSYADDMV